MRGGVYDLAICVMILRTFAGEAVCFRTRGANNTWVYKNMIRINQDEFGQKLKTFEKACTLQV